MASKFYVVWKGRTPDVYATWDEARAQVDGFTGARYHGFTTREEADHALSIGYDAFRQDKSAVKNWPPEVMSGYAVDASLPITTGLLEYRCVKIDTRKELFRQGPFEGGTINVGEFLVIVHALALFKRENIAASIYSDSKSARAWVREKHAKTEMVRTEKNAALFELVDRAEAWLRENDYDTQVLKWDTEAWGENPADFGRK